MKADPTPIFDLAIGFWKSSVLFAACRMRLFDVLAENPVTIEQAATALNCSQRGIKGLLESLTALGLAEYSDGEYANSETSAAFLTTDSPASLLTTLDLQAATYPMWDNLAEAVRSGKPVIPPTKLLGDDPELTRTFVIGMHRRAIGAARELVEHVDLSDRKLLADIGGGPGTYSVLLTQKFPKLRAQVMDLPPILAVARELIADSDSADRIDTIPCNACEDSFEPGFDAALVSGLIHRMSPASTKDIFQKIYDALPSGGLMVVNDLFAEEHKPEMAVLFGLQMLLTNEEGETHSASDIARWMGSIGFEDIDTVTLSPPLPHTVVTGSKKA